MKKLKLLGAALCAAALGACSPSGPPVRVSATDLYAAYLRNAVAADDQYRGHILIVDGMSGGIDSEPDGYILTIVPGVRAHLGSKTSGTNLFQHVAVQCDGVAFKDVVLSLTDCEIVDSPATAPSSSPDMPAPSAIEPPSTSQAPLSERLSAAFQAATGHQTSFVIDEGEDGGSVITPSKIVDLPFGPVLLTEQKDEQGCHSCKGYIGIHYLFEQNGSFQLRKSWPKAIEGSGWGKPPSVWYVTGKFTAYPAIYTETGYMYQGDSGKDAGITELQPDQPVTSESVDLGLSNEGNYEQLEKPLCQYSGKIIASEKDKSFAVRLKGSVNGDDRYAKRGGKFVRVAQAPRGAACE